MIDEGQSKAERREGEAMRTRKNEAGQAYLREYARLWAIYRTQNTTTAWTEFCAARLEAWKAFLSA